VLITLLEALGEVVVEIGHLRAWRPAMARVVLSYNIIPGLVWVGRGRGWIKVSWPRVWRAWGWALLHITIYEAMDTSFAIDGDVIDKI